MRKTSRHNIRDSFRRRAELAKPPGYRPDSDVWGLYELSIVDDTHFRRPGEGLIQAIGRWAHFLFGSTVLNYIDLTRQCIGAITFAMCTQALVRLLDKLF